MLWTTQYSPSLNGGVSSWTACYGILQTVCTVVMRYLRDWRVSVLISSVLMSRGAVLMKTRAVIVGRRYMYVLVSRR